MPMSPIIIAYIPICPLSLLRNAHVTIIIFKPMSFLLRPMSSCRIEEIPMSPCRFEGSGTIAGGLGRGGCQLDGAGSEQAGLSV